MVWVWDISLPGKYAATVHGGFNPSTGTKPDCIEPQANCYVFSPGCLNLTLILKNSNNLKCTINERAKELVHLCQVLVLYIINGTVVSERFL